MSSKDTQHQSNIDSIKKDLANSQIEYLFHYNKMREYQQKVIKLKKSLTKICIHQYEIDRSDQHTHYICKLCQKFKL
jgi:hypothetical protein